MFKYHQFNHNTSSGRNKYVLPLLAMDVGEDPATIKASKHVVRKRQVMPGDVMFFIYSVILEYFFKNNNKLALSYKRLRTAVLHVCEEAMKQHFAICRLKAKCH